jgi:YbgC/YbaW family acyl-CoA thioester hydrolase
MTQQTYQHHITIPFQDIDAAGIVFFAHLFRYAHEAYERFMSAHHHSLAGVLRNGEYLLPLVHAEADYQQPLRHNESVTLELSVKKLGDSSFTLQYRCLDSEGRLRAVVETVHVTLDVVTQRPMPIPDSLRAVLATAYTV